MSDHDMNKGTEEAASGVVIGRGIKIVGESVVPGASQVLDGNLLSGAAHLVGAMVARWALGPVGWFLVAANSYSKSVTGRHLPQYLQSSSPKKVGETSTAAAATSEA